MRAALVGAVVGLTQFILLCWRGPDIGILDLFGLLVVPYSLGFFLSWWGMLPRWAGVATVGPGVTAAFALVNLPLLEIPEDTYLGDWKMCLIFMALSASSYLAAGGLVMPVHRRLRALTVGGVAVAYLAVWSAQGVIAETARADRLARAGIPLIAPVLPDHQLVYASDSESWLQLWYADENNAHAVEVAVGPVFAAPPKVACVKSLPWRDPQGTAECREAAPGVWVRDGEVQTSVFATTANALVRVESSIVPEADLIAMLRTFRPVEASELVRLQELD